MTNKILRMSLFMLQEMKTEKLQHMQEERQKNNFGKLYIHNVITKDDGLDV